jgi:hypothetical protein
LSYLGLAFVTLGGLFSLLTARTLLEVTNHTQDLIDKKYSLDEKILSQRAVAACEARTGVFKTCAAAAQALLRRLERHRHIIDHHLGGQSVVISFILLGMLCFFVALIFQVIVTQPPRLWIPFILLVILMSGLLAWKEARTHPQLLTYISSRAGLDADHEGGDIPGNPAIRVITSENVERAEIDTGDENDCILHATFPDMMHQPLMRQISLSCSCFLNREQMSMRAVSDFSLPGTTVTETEI